MIESVIKCRTNGELIAVTAPLWLRPTDRVLDVTYGRGGFWTLIGPKEWPLVEFDGHDLYVLDGVNFLQLPEADGSVDVVVFDPPYVSQGGRDTSTEQEFMARYGLYDAPRTPTEQQAEIAAGIKECARVLAPRGRLLVKTMDYVSSGRKVWGRRHVIESAEAAGLKHDDEFIHHSGTGPQPKHARQVRARAAHSYLEVFVKPNRRRRVR